jgi:hypothetical protein
VAKLFVFYSVVVVVIIIPGKFISRQNISTTTQTRTYLSCPQPDWLGKDSWRILVDNELILHGRIFLRVIGPGHPF